MNAVAAAAAAGLGLRKWVEPLSDPERTCSMRPANN